MLDKENDGISVGDNIRIDGKDYRITGFSTVPDYTSLYKKNTDFMFNALDFCVAFVTKQAFEDMSDTGIVYNYAWMYKDRNLSDQEKHDKSVSLMDDLSEASEDELDKLKQDIVLQMMSGKLDLSKAQISESDMPAVLTDFIPSESNSAINMATDDVGGDKIFVLVLLYITIAVIALATAITTKSTAEQDAGVIGTLRASGYHRRELVGHYMVISVITVFVAAVLGNIMGYTFMNDLCASMYYGSYSFPSYTPIINAEAFITTTFVPVAIVLIIELVMLMRLMSLPPLQFLRRELKRRKTSRSIPLRFGSFKMRFRIRVILRNYQAYLVLFVGILFANLLLMFSLIWNPMFDSFRSVIMDNIIAEHQYILKAQTETDTQGAEKFAIYSVKNDNGEDITVYGISENSQYVRGLDFSGDNFYFSSAYADKYGVNVGDTVHFSEKFSTRTYDFKNELTYDYPPSLCVFTGLENFRKIFDKGSDYFTGYFSNEKIEDIDEMYIASEIGRSDLTSSADQLENSVGFVRLFALFAVAVYILMIYILSKMITERNARSISVLKILGYKNGEISGLYNLATGVVVMISMLVSLPLIGWLIFVLYHEIMMRYNGWITFYLDPMLYPEMIGIGVLCFLAAYVFEMRRVRRVAMNEAIKDIE